METGASGPFGEVVVFPVAWDTYQGGDNVTVQFLLQEAKIVLGKIMDG